MAAKFGPGNVHDHSSWLLKRNNSALEERQTLSVFDWAFCASRFLALRKVLQSKNCEALGVSCFEVLTVKHSFYTFSIAKVLFTEKIEKHETPTRIRQSPLAWPFSGWAGNWHESVILVADDEQVSKHTHRKDIGNGQKRVIWGV